MAAYDKAHLTFEQQVNRLRERGMVIEDQETAETSLAAIGYYRLSAYAHSFRIPLRPSRLGHDERFSEFVQGTTFADVMDLWEFDRNLRLHVLDGLERFEIALRTAIAYNLGKRSAYGHLEVEHLDENFVRQPPTTSSERLSKHDKWLQDYYERQSRAEKEAFVSWFAFKYEAKLPIWVAIEILEFGQTSFLFQGLKLGDRDAVARTFGVDRSKQFMSWIASFNDMRNFSAHHSRLWNRTLVKQASRPVAGSIEELDHLRLLDDGNAAKLYPSLAMLTWILRTHVPSPDWAAGLRDLLEKFPANDIVSLSNAGFPDDWSSLSLWQ